MYLFNCMIIEKRKNSVYFMSIFPSEFAYYVIGHLSLRIPFLSGSNLGYGPSQQTVNRR